MPPGTATVRTFSLQPGRPGVKRELAANDVDAYEVALTAGQYLVARVDQIGIDVAVDVLGPERSRLFQVNSPNGSWGPEWVHLVADVTGSYRLEVRGASGVAPGRYQARIDTLRPATAGDRRRAAAERAFFEARGWNAQAPPFWEQAARYEKAVRLFHLAGARDREAYALYQLGLQQENGAHHEREALDLFGDARALYSAAGDLKYVALCDNEIGRCESGVGEIDRARAAYESALAGWRRLPPRPGRVVTLNNLGELNAVAGRYEEALHQLEEAAEAASSLHLRDQEAEARLWTGWVFRSLGQLDKAQTELWRTFRIATAAGPWRPRALNEIAGVFLGAGQPWRARPYLEMALRLEPEGAEEARAVILESLGICYRRLAEYSRALTAYGKARAIFQKRRNPRAEANAWISLGAIYLYMQQPQRANDCFVKAQGLALGAGYAESAAQALLGMALAASDRGLLNTALADAKTAIQEVETLRAAAARPDLRRATVALNTNFFELVVELLMRLHAQHPSAGYNLEALQYSEQARARELHADLAARRQAAAAGAPAIDPALRGELRRLRMQIAAADRGSRVLPAGDSLPDVVQPKLEALIDRSRAIAELIAGQAGPAADPPYGTFPPPLTYVQQHLLDEQTLLLDFHLGRSRGFLWAVTPDSVASFELPGRERLEPLVRSLYERWSRSQEPIEPAGRAGSGASSGAANSAPGDGEAAELSHILLGPVAGRLASRRLLIVADGPLQYIPFEALPDPASGGLLVESHEVAYAPSLAVLAELRARQQLRRTASALARAPRAAATPTGALAILADPVFGAGDRRAAALGVPAPSLDPLVAELPRLPDTGAEAEAIVAAAGARGALLALGFDANRELVTSGRLAGYPILHFATHNLLRAGQPELTALALSQIDRAGRPRDGLLRAMEIADLDLPADLVVLSACNTALGEPTEGEGLVGLPQSFLGAGAGRVVVSLWSVGDRSTAVLMSHFYRALLEERLAPAAALRAAQIAMLRDSRWRSPYYWAGFVLQGDWR
jgi:CHAT domain-containing protein/tetratricopeptide (TPR) repeat protein